MSKKSSEFVLVTPEMAGKLLAERVTANRDISQTFVDHLSRLMSEGKWMDDTAQTIGLTVDGRLSDGQHRMAAIVKCGIPRVFLVVTGVRHDHIIEGADQNHKRTFAQWLKMKGYKNNVDLAALIAWLYRYNNAVGTGALGSASTMTPFRVFSSVISNSIARAGE